MLYGKYNEEDLEVNLEISDSDFLSVQKDSHVFAKIPLSQVKNVIEKKLGYELTDTKFSRLSKKISGMVRIQSDFSIGLSEPYVYGADADGNRGETRQDYESMENDDIELNEASLFLFDEKGKEIGTIDLLTLIPTSDDSLVGYIATEINNDPNSYVD